tara:strand:- start:35225 stop:36781 length:1557 start_codon:yes stop_codon:yes gene_type:complete
MAPIALLSVSNKQGLVPLAKTLIEEHGFQLISSGGTASLLESENIPVTRISDYTGAPEILGGRVKTLHPKIHGGILAKRSNKDHQNDLEKQNIKQIDLVVVNLYPFQETILQPNVSWEKAIENIDIGGPTLIRAAAKNHQFVAILSRPDQYEPFLKALKAGEVSDTTRKKLAIEAFEHTSSYDSAIHQWMSLEIDKESKVWTYSLPLQQKLRYGENPHQKASWYSQVNQGWGGAIQLQGKELSTNNLLDLEAALSTVREFGYGSHGLNPIVQKAAVVVKHTNPCGVAIGPSISIALQRALDADRISAFGGIVAVNCSVDSSTANELKNLFLECVVAPSFDKEAKEILSKKKNLRLLELSPLSIDNGKKDYVRSILGGVLIQDPDDQIINEKNWKVVTNRKPQPEEYEDLAFAWRLVRHIRSNAIAIASSGQSLGIGAGQMNRVGSAKLALETAGEKAKGSVLASDGFFPFDDTVRLASTFGVKAIIQPGGSLKDQESINACNELNIAMIHTGQRHFLH